MQDLPPMCDMEMKRIGECAGLTTMPASPWEFELDVGDHAVDFAERVRTVVAEIAKHQPNQWPEDAYWKTVLPSWLIDYMPELSSEECVKLMAATPREQWPSLPWQFGSWLDAMRERGWS